MWINWIALLKQALVEPLRLFNLLAESKMESLSMCFTVKRRSVLKLVRYTMN